MSSYSDTTSSTESYMYYRSDNERFSRLKTNIKKSDRNRPLAHLTEKEHLLKEEKDEPSGMPQELILFDPKELVLGGKK